MADITVDQEQKKLIVVVEGIERLWILNSRFEIPLAHIKGASINPEVASNLPYPRQEQGDPQWHAPFGKSLTRLKRWSSNSKMTSMLSLSCRSMTLLLSSLRLIRPSELRLDFAI